MAGNNSLTITVQQKEAGEVLSTLTLDYPSLENASANVLSMDLVDAISATVEKWGAAKAQLIGEGELFEAATVVRRGVTSVLGQATPPGQAKKA